MLFGRLASDRIDRPQPAEPFYGQDAQYQGIQPAYRDNGDGTVTDLNTGLVWQRTPSFEHYTWAQATVYAETTGNRRLEEFWADRSREDFATAAGGALFAALDARRRS